MCDDYFGTPEGTVACQQMGFLSLLSIINSRGSGTIWLDDLKCFGNETMLTQCEHNGWGIHNCGHYEDVGLRCFNRK